MESTWVIIDIAAINLMASGATTITERLRKSPSKLSDARNDLRITNTSLLSLNPLAHFEVSTSASGPEKSMKEIRITTRRAREYTAASSVTFELY
jgi:hypothetical protein